jgi:hypothetical protein
MAPPMGSLSKGVPPQDSFEGTSLISSVVIPEDEERTGEQVLFQSLQSVEPILFELLKILKHKK